jgi:hypothetical protein
VPIIARDSGGGGDFTPAPAGVHQAVCVDVIDMGMVLEQFPGQSAKDVHKIRLAWQIEENMNNGKPFLVQKRYTLSLHEKANLRHDLEGWRARPFTDEELAGFDVEAVIGKNCLLNVVHSTKPGGKTYANVSAVMPLKKGMAKMDASEYTRVKDRTPEDGNGPSDPEPPAITEEDIPF